MIFLRHPRIVLQPYGSSQISYIQPLVSLCTPSLHSLHLNVLSFAAMRHGDIILEPRIQGKRKKKQILRLYTDYRRYQVRGMGLYPESYIPQRTEKLSRDWTKKSRGARPSVLQIQEEQYRGRM